MKLKVKLLLLVFLFSFAVQAQKEYTVYSPDKTIAAKVWIDGNGNPLYSVSRKGEVVLEKSKLGLVREDEDFSKSLNLVAVSPVSTITDNYELVSSKRKNNTYKANRQVFHMKSSNGDLLDVIFQVSNDGVAFRYYFPGTSREIKKINEENTSFNFASSAKGWLQPMSDAKTGWANVHPSYEEYYEQGVPVGTPSPIGAGWVYPALFQTGNNWVLITESFPGGNYAATRLKAQSPEGEYSIGFPQPQEVFPGGALNPESELPWYSPWRIITIGSLETIVESSLGTDLAEPAVKIDQSFIKPGISSWSWPILGDDSTVYEVQKRFVDFAADMGWKYTLVDAQWDQQIGYDKMKELVNYAESKGVGILVWYNSAGSWNETFQTPKNKLLTHEDRVKEFSRIQEMGIKGVKIDFFGGDSQSMLNYYHEVLKDAAEYKLLVNYHGSTLPRGLHRTYPHLMTMEAVKGFEFRMFGDQKNEDVQPTHAAMLPFTRNAFDPMDYTPMTLGPIKGLNKKTTNAFELALPVIFTSGIQHIADIPRNINAAPDYVKQFLRQLPPSWDEVEFVDGFPGKYVVIARKAGNKWYVAGINGDTSEKQLELDLSFIKNAKSGQMITNGKDASSFISSKVSPKKGTKVNIKPAGGFVMVFE